MQDNATKEQIMGIRIERKTLVYDSISDINSSGVWFLPDNIGEKTGDWVVQMLYGLMQEVTV